MILTKTWSPTKLNYIFFYFLKVSSINRVLRNLASKSFDSSSTTSSSNGAAGDGGGGGGTGASSNLTGCQEANVYDKLRLLNNGQPWSSHASAWYVPSSAVAAAAAVNAAFSHHLGSSSSSNGGQTSPLPYNPMSHLDLINEQNSLNGGSEHLHHHLHGHHHLHPHHLHHHILNSNDIKLDLNGNECKKG